MRKAIVRYSPTRLLPYTPSDSLCGQSPPPTRREAAPYKFLRIKFVGVPPPLQAPSLAFLKSYFHPHIVSLTFKVPSLFGGADVLIYRHKVRRGRGADAGERSPDEPTAHPRDRPPSGVFIDVFSFLFLFSGGRVFPCRPFFYLTLLSNLDII